MNFTGDYSILKLNVFAYVFSQNMVIIEAQNCEINKVDIYIYDNNNTEYRDGWVFNSVDKVERDISYQLRQFFSIDSLLTGTGYSETSIEVSIGVSIYTTLGIDTFESRCVLIFGAVKPFKYYFNNSIVKVKQFSNLPFSVDFLLKPKGRVDQSLLPENLYINSRSVTAMINVDLQKPAIKDGKSYLVYTSDTISVNTNDDYPLIGTEAGNMTYFIRYSDCTDGIYLMWLNSLGGRSYFLFKNKGETLNIEKEEYNKKNYMNNAIFDTVKQCNKIAKRVLTLALPMIDKTEYGYVEEVLYSPMVYMLSETKDSFIRVNVKTGDFDRTSAELQDFVFKIELPEELTIKI